LAAQGSYDAFIKIVSKVTMKHNSGFLFALLLLASSGLAQTSDSQTTNNLPENDLPKQVALARSAYTQTEEVNADGAPNNSKSNNTLAQIPRRMPGPMARPPMRRAAYPNMWTSGGSPGHALIGALIGFGLGAAVGAKGNPGVRATLAIGTVGAGIGAAIGFSIPSFPGRNMYRRGWPDDDEEEASRRSKPGSHKPEPKTLASAKRDAAGAPGAARTDSPESEARAEDSLQLALSVP
jgi:hypothetical protein